MANVVTDIIHEADIPEEYGEEAALIIQHAYRAFKERHTKEKELLFGMVDWRVAARSAIRLYRKTGVTHEEANRAATLIKAAYKGYYTRRVMKKILTESIELEKQKKILEIEESVESEYSEEEVATEEPGISAVHSKGDKGVKINFDTVVPHVDFGDSRVIDPHLTSEAISEKSVRKSGDKLIDKPLEKFPEKPSTASMAVSAALDHILDLAFKRIDGKLHHGKPEDSEREEGEEQAIAIEEPSAPSEPEQEIQEVDLNDINPEGEDIPPETSKEEITEPEQQAEQITPGEAEPES